MPRRPYPAKCRPRPPDKTRPIIRRPGRSIASSKRRSLRLGGPSRDVRIRASSNARPLGSRGILEVPFLPTRGTGGAGPDRCAGLLAVAGAVVAGAPSTPIGRVPVAGRSRASKLMSPMRRSNPTALWVSDRERATARSAWMMLRFRAATAMRVWQRQSMEWMAAVLAAEPAAMPKSMSRRVQVGPANSRSAELSRSGLVAWRNSAQVA
jgi:hypothetical protein